MILYGDILEKYRRNEEIKSGTRINQTIKDAMREKRPERFCHFFRHEERDENIRRVYKI